MSAQGSNLWGAIYRWTETPMGSQAIAAGNIVEDVALAWAGERWLLRSAPDRFALARALVADMPGVVVGVVPDNPLQAPNHHNPDGTTVWRQGWNACRAAMLANGEKNDGR